MDFLNSLEQLGLSTWVRESPSVFAYPTVLLLHVMGMAIVAGVGAVISLRLLGAAPQTRLQPLERLYPLMWWGFAVNALTGTALMLANAATKLIEPVFYIKMLLIFGGVAVLQMTRSKIFRNASADGELPQGARALAWAGLFCWAGAVTAGRLLAYVV